jgi:hypothetical protein
MQPAIRERGVANSQMEQTVVSAISNAALARRARRSGDGGGSARRVRSAFGDGHIGSGFQATSLAGPSHGPTSIIAGATSPTRITGETMSAEISL